MSKTRPVRLPHGELTVLGRRDLAAYLGVSERTIDRLKPPSLTLGRYLLRDVLAWLAARQRAA